MFTAGGVVGVRVAINGKLLQVVFGLKVITPRGFGLTVMITVLDGKRNVFPIQGTPSTILRYQVVTVKEPGE